MSPCHRERACAVLDFTLDWDEVTVRLRLMCRGGYRLPYNEITVALPAADRRRLLLKTGSEAPPLVAGRWQIHL